MRRTPEAQSRYAHLAPGLLLCAAGLHTRLGVFCVCHFLLTGTRASETHSCLGWQEQQKLGGNAMQCQETKP